jgi:hypothetical protein
MRGKRAARLGARLLVALVVWAALVGVLALVGLV